jgi:hypothetical protein
VGSADRADDVRPRAVPRAGDRREGGGGAAHRTGQDNAWENIGVDDFAKFGLLQISGILQGLAFGLLLLNSAAAIVLYFVLPIAFNIIVTLWTRMQDIAPWIDLGTSQQPLFSGVNLTGEEWAQLATSSAIWILLPLVFGLWRVMRAEVK